MRRHSDTLDVFTVQRSAGQPTVGVALLLVPFDGLGSRFVQEEGVGAVLCSVSLQQDRGSAACLAAALV